jgi:hypothetical protein
MKRNRISEATGSGSAGNFKVPIVLSPQPWTEDQVAPFTNPVYSYNNAELAYEEADGDFKETPEERARIEKRTDRIAQVDRYLKSFYTGQNDEDGSNVADIEDPEKIIQQAVGPLKEDLAVWFGTKKKPKGSSQPKGPWVNICRKKEGGGHPPCGRPEASDKGYPKCRAAGVASKMTDSEKRSACQQKRNAEKTHSKSGTGNSPKMVSYKPKNESMKQTIKLTESELIKLVKKVLTEEVEQQDNKMGLFRKPKIYDMICGIPNKKDFPELNSTQYCKRPIVLNGSVRDVKHIKLTCDNINGGVLATIADGLQFSCNSFNIESSGNESYNFIDKNEPGWEQLYKKQVQSDINYFKNICRVVEKNRNKISCK